MGTIETEADDLLRQHALLAAGYTVGVAWRAASDHFAGVIGFTAANLDQAEELVDAAAADMKASIRRNWSYLCEQRGRQPARSRGRG